MIEATINIEAEFGAAMAAYGLNPPEIIADGMIHRFDSDDDKKGKKSAWYVLHGDGVPNGTFGNWKADFSEKWCSKPDHALTPVERADYRQRNEKAKQESDAAKLLAQAEAARACAAIMATAPDAAEDNPYCVRKGVKPYGLKEFEDKRTLIVPVRDGAGHLTSVQFIYADGTKRFKAHGRIEGCYYAFGETPVDTLLLCEGYATGASLHAATGYPVAVAFNAGNLEPVARVLRAKLPDVRIVVCADNDKFSDSGNVGLTKATLAAPAVGGLLAVPQFASDDGKPTDFNDMCLAEGADAVLVCIESAVAGAKISPVEVDTGWADPEPLVRNTEAWLYPVDVLPDVIRLAVEEVQAFTMAPVAMVACSALANLSLAVQAHHDVQRAEKLSGPTSLYFLVVAESGERKSTCDGIFSKVLRDYESQQQEDAKPAINQFKADFSAWEATRSGITEAIKQEAKKPKSGANADQLHHDLRKHQEKEPQPPRVPRLIYSDFTPEALTYSLSKVWPSGGVISSEAGAVFGSHGMTGDSQMRTLANLNQLWEAARLTFDRRSAGGSYVVDGARLTMSLQVQESALMEFFKRTGTLARGTGFLARFLMAHPESTQGTRFYREPPENMPALASYHAQLHRIIQVPAPMNENGGLEPSMLTLTPEAKAAWIVFHDEIENGLSKGGELAEVRDVASKIADNAVRLAALFHVIDGGIGSIGLQHFDSASKVAAWHMNEALRFFGGLALPEAEADAVALDEWLVDYCNINCVDVVQTRVISQFGPYKLRGKERLNASVQELIERNRIVVIQSGKKREIQINPQLLGGNHGAC